jgi:tetratricopeptide (TPR) repeat protein
LLEADRLLPGSAEIKAQLAFSLAGAGRLKEAQNEIEAARALDPSSPGLDSVEGMILLALNQDEEAIEFLSRAVEREPGDSRSWLAMGKIFYRRGMLEKAADAFSKATTADSKNAEAWFYLGEIELAGRRFEQAVTQYKTVRSLDPGYVEAYRQEAVAFQRLGRQGEAVGILEQALLITPEDVELLYVLGSVLSEAGDDEAAVSHLLEARELSPNHSRVRYLLGVTLAKLGRREESREELAAFRELRAFEDEAEGFQDVLLAHPEDADSYLPLIHHYFDHGREVEALAFLQKASALSPDHLELLLLMARARIATGQAELAGEAVDRALALDPANTEALALREKVRQ